VGSWGFGGGCWGGGVGFVREDEGGGDGGEGGAGRWGLGCRRVGGMGTDGDVAYRRGGIAAVSCAGCAGWNL